MSEVAGCELTRGYESFDAPLGGEDSERSAHGMQRQLDAPAVNRKRL